MRTSREWIEKTATALDAPQSGPTPPATPKTPRPRPSRRGELTVEITLTAEEAEALDAICREDELSPAQALGHIVSARLLAKPQFARGDRARLRACLELLRALEQHVGRAARPAGALRQTGFAAQARVEELLELGGYLRRVGRGIGEAMLGNLAYWRGEARERQALPQPESEGIVAEAGEDHIR